MEESRLALSLWGEYYSKSRQENLRSHVESGTVNSHSANALAFIQSFYKSFSTQRMISRRRNPFSCGCFSCEGDNYEEVKRSTIEKVRQVLETEETGRGRMIAAFNPRLKNSQGLTGLKDPRQTAIVQSHTSLPDRRESMIFSAPKRDLNTNLYSSLHSKTPVRHNSDMPGFAIEFKQRWSHGSCSHLNSPSPLKASGQVESPGEDHDKSKGRNETNDCNRRAKTLPPQNSDSIEHGKLDPETLLKCIGNLFNENNEPQILRALQYLALGIEEYMDSFGMCLPELLQVVLAALTSPIIPIVVEALKLSLSILLTYGNFIIHHENQELFSTLLARVADLSVRFESGAIHKMAEKLLKYVGFNSDI